MTTKIKVKLVTESGAIPPGSNQAFFVVAFRILYSYGFEL